MKILYDCKWNIDTDMGYEYDTNTLNKHYFGYEPTVYEHLDVMFDDDSLNICDVLVDYGCGKGRVLVYVCNRFGCVCRGVEYNDEVYNMLTNNINNYSSISESNIQIDSYNCRAEDYIVTEMDNVFFFYNPFSIKIFIKVLINIMKSYDKKKRKLTFYLYCPQKLYVNYLLRSNCNVDKHIIFDDVYKLRGEIYNYEVYVMSSK